MWLIRVEWSVWKKGLPFAVAGTVVLALLGVISSAAAVLGIMYLLVWTYLGLRREYPRWFAGNRFALTVLGVLVLYGVVGALIKAVA